MSDESTLPGFQRKYLRGLAHHIKPCVQVGRSGVTEEVGREVSRALEDHELIKVSMLRPLDKKAMAEDLASRTGAQMCGLVGHTVILYRARAEDPEIRLPARRP